MDRYDYMRAAGAELQQNNDGNIMLRDLGTPVLPPLTNGQPPVGNGTMATMPPPAPVAPRPGQATGTSTGTSAGQPVRPVQPGQPDYRPAQPSPSDYRPAQQN